MEQFSQLTTLSMVSTTRVKSFEFWVFRFRDLGVFVFEFWVLRFRFRVLRFRDLGLRFRILGASFSRFGCFVLRSSFSSASFSKLPILGARMSATVSACLSLEKYFCSFSNKISCIISESIPVPYSRENDIFAFQNIAITARETRRKEI